MPAARNGGCACGLTETHGVEVDRPVVRIAGFVRLVDQAKLGHN